MQTVLITGSNRGIGLELTRQYLTNGDQVFACCREPLAAQELHKLKKSFDKLEIVQLEVSSEKSCQSLSASLAEQPIDILINNAGIYGNNTPFGEIDFESIEDCFRINALAPLRLSQLLIPQIEKGTRKLIANMSSKMGSITENTSGNTYAYRSSKAALNCISKSLAIDLADRGISVVALHPGWVQTAMGGPSALISTTESAKGLVKVLQSVDKQQSGSFLNYKGEIVPW